MTSTAPRGTLRLYLGIAPGVGKTYALLAEGRRLMEAGDDVAVGVVELHEREDTAAQLDALEVVPVRRMRYRGTEFDEMDQAALLARHPHTVLVDELAHTNVPGSRHDRRWQDVEELLEAGIDVVSALNIQHLESLSDEVEDVTGIPVRETVPDRLTAAAERVELLDVDPDTLRRRVSHLYAPDTADRALAGYFRPGNLAALRTLARRWIDDHAPTQAARHASSGPPAPTAVHKERVVVALTGDPEGDHVLRRAARLATATRAQLIGVHVHEPTGLAEPDPPWLEGQRRLLTELGGRYAQIAGTDVARAILDFAENEHAYHLVLGASRRTTTYELLYGSVIGRAIHHAGFVEVHVIPFRRPPRRPLATHLPHLTRHRKVPLSPRRTAVGWLLAVLAPLAMAAVLLPARATLGLAGALFCTLLTVVLTAIVGGFRPAVTATVIGFLAADFLYTQPYYSLRVTTAIDLAALLAFAVVGTTVGLLVDLLARQGLQAARSRVEAKNLARLLADVIADGPRTPQELVDALRRTFDLDTIALLRPTRAGWHTEAATNDRAPSSPDEAPFSAQLADGRVLVMAGDRLTAKDAQLLREFATQLRLTQERTQLGRLDDT